MSYPDGEFLHGLELEVEAELAMAESSRPEQVVDTPVTEWLFDPADVQRYEAGLRSELGAVEALENRDDRTHPETFPPDRSG